MIVAQQVFVQGVDQETHRVPFDCRVASLHTNLIEWIQGDI
jgi:hypothetical protein